MVAREAGGGRVVEVEGVLADEALGVQTVDAVEAGTLRDDGWVAGVVG